MNRLAASGMVAGLILALGFAVGYGWAAKRAAGIEAGLQYKLTQIGAANVDNLETIRALRERNRELAEGRAADRQAAAQAVAEAIMERDAMSAELEKRRHDRGELYREDQEAAAWARARVPDSVARLLRE